MEEDNKLNLSVVIADMMHLMSHVREVLFLTSGRCEDEKKMLLMPKHAKIRMHGAQAPFLQSARAGGGMHCGCGEGEVATQGWKEQVERRN